MMGCVALSSIVFFDAMYDDMVLSRSACQIDHSRASARPVHLSPRRQTSQGSAPEKIAILRIHKSAGEFAPAPS